MNKAFTVIALTLALGACKAQPPKADIHYQAKPVLMADLTAAEAMMAKAAIPAAPQTQLAYFDAKAVVVRGDTLWSLSQRLYGTAFLWPLLCESNGIGDCDRIEVGDILRIPSPDLVKNTDVSAYLGKAYGSR